MSRQNHKKYLPAEKVYVAPSVPYEELSFHLKKMINSQCHLIWIDCISINQVNYFNLLWQSNYDESKCIGFASPPQYMIFFDLNTAQLAQLNYEFSTEELWNLELIDSYIKTQTNLNSTDNDKTNYKPQSPNRKKIKDLKNLAIQKSTEEIFYICQFKKITNNKETLNKLQHSIIDTRYNESFERNVQYFHNTKTTSIPIRQCPIVVNVNTLTNKHFYYTSLYTPIENYTYDDNSWSNHTNHLKQSNLYQCIKNLNDSELVKLFEKNSQNGLKMVDLKAYKDEKSFTKFSTIWSSLPHFYEGTFKLYLGLTKSEAISKINEMNERGMSVKIITSYFGEISTGEHVYALFFCQF